MEYSKNHVKTTSSTNSYLKENAESLPSPFFYRADYQSQGKGRMGRQWLSEEGDNLLFSLLVKDKEIVALGGKLSLIVAVSIAKTLESLFGLEGVSIKWPNDIYIKGKKAVGILLEGRVPEYIVIGMGINVNQTRFEGDFRAEPTSLFLETGKKIDLDELEKALEDKLISSFYDGEIALDPYLEYYASHDFLKGKKAKAIATGDIGTVLGVDSDFRLLLSTKKGVLSLSSGEVDIHLN